MMMKYSRVWQRNFFANNVQTGRKIRLIGFRLGHLDTPSTKQTRLNDLLEEE